MRYLLDANAVIASLNDPRGRVLIAGPARARGLSLVTRNMREFQRVAGLAVENWQDDFQA